MPVSRMTYESLAIVVVSSVAMIVPGVPCAFVVRTLTSAGFDTGQYWTVPWVRLIPCPTTIGTNPETMLRFTGPPIHPGEIAFTGVGVGEGVGVGLADGSGVGVGVGVGGVAGSTATETCEKLEYCPSLAVRRRT